MASTISGGRPNRTFSGITSISRILVKPFCFRNSITCSTRTSGADAPAVRATVLTPASHSDFTSEAVSIRYEGVPRLVETSTRRLELELFSDPTTSSRSAW